MNRKEKEQFVADLAESLSSSKILSLALYQGLSVPEMNELRKNAREQKVAIKVTKNNLTKLALANTAFANLVDLFKGTTLIAHSTDVVAGVKVLADFAKSNDKLQILGASMEGNLLDVAAVKQLASLPSQDELRAKIIGLLTAPAAKIARCVNEPAAKLARVFGAKAAA